MNWKNEAVNDLRNLEKRRTALESLRGDILGLQDRLYSLKACAADKVPVQGGASTQEDRTIAAVDEMERKKTAYAVTRRYVDACDNALAKLPAQQQDVLELFFINRTNNHVERLAEKYHVEKSQVYRMKDEAVTAFTMARYGIVEV